MNNYSTIIQWSDEDEGYIAIVPELPGVSAFGETIEEAARELEIAKQLVLKVYAEDGCPLPDPDKLRDFSGQLRLRIPKSLHASLSAEAKKESISLNAYIGYLLSKNNETHKLTQQIRELKSALYNQVLGLNNFTQPQVESNAYSFSGPHLTIPSSGTAGKRLQ